MCQWCDMADVNKEHACKEYFIHHPFIITNDHNGETIIPNGDNPIMYLREYRGEMKGKWSLVCEFANNSGDAIETRVATCPICGRPLN